MCLRSLRSPRSPSLTRVLISTLLPSPPFGLNLPSWSTSHPPILVDRLPTCVGPRPGPQCADLGHTAAQLSVHLRWVACLEEEFFRQGDAERDAGLPISPLFDRSKQGITKSQVRARSGKGS